MLRSLKDLEGYRVSTTDGEVGRVADFLLDDREWISRYLVVNTGTWMNDRDVLISPSSFRRIEWEDRLFHLALTKEQILNSPGIATDLPVSRKQERDFLHYYGYPDQPGGADTEVHLRSVKHLQGYHIHGSDDEIGHIADFIVDSDTWAIRYLVVNTGTAWLGKQVLIAPSWAIGVDWQDQQVNLSLAREEIKNCPEWFPDAPVNRSYEARLFDYYGRPVYWDSSNPQEDPRTQII